MNLDCRFYLPCVGVIDDRDVCLLSDVMKLGGTRLAVLKAPNNTLEKLFFPPDQHEEGSMQSHKDERLTKLIK